MDAKILDGKAIAESIKAELKNKVAQRQEAGFRAPGLAVIMIGEDPASEIYVRNKRKACEEVGFISKAIDCPMSITTKALQSLIESLNEDKTIDGILVQLPLPIHIDQNDILETISPGKDVDGFHPYNLGRLAQRRPLFRSCTPLGIMRLLSHTNKDLKGLEATVIGVSNIVGRPMILELMMAGCTVTACHRFTADLPKAVSQADILIVATGHPHLVPGEWIKPGAIVIDVGINRQDDGSLIGDVIFASAKLKASWITPVPGGVGPMTIAALLENTFYANQRHCPCPE